jgi:hypothetical protein
MGFYVGSKVVKTMSFLPLPVMGGKNDIVLTTLDPT